MPHTFEQLPGCNFLPSVHDPIEPKNMIDLRVLSVLAPSEEKEVYRHLLRDAGRNEFDNVLLREEQRLYSSKHRQEIGRVKALTK
jgi:hypothetical protein